jgi:hypothetical protein
MSYLDKRRYKGYVYPKTNQQEILLMLITKRTVSFFDFPYLVSFRTRVSEFQVKHGIFLQRFRETRVNKFGNTYSFVVYGLPEQSYKQAVALYKKLTAENNLPPNENQPS